MKSLFVLFIALFVFVLSGASQVLDGAYEKQNVVGRKPVPYTFIRENDVLFSKRIWRIIDLRELINNVLYFPIEDKYTDRVSLFNLIMRNIEAGKLKAYNPGLTGSDDFNVMEEMTLEQIKEKFGSGQQKTEEIVDPVTGNITTKTTTSDGINADEIKQFLVKEDWFFDKQRSVLDVRIIGICPIRWYTKDLSGMGGVAEESKMKTFWIYFPEARPIFAKTEVFNEKNSSNGLSFDDYFMKRRFGSTIVQEANTYDNRPVDLFRDGVFAMQESERIKESMFKAEHDLWTY